jgi:glycine cleavage system H lipoate-binding protein
MRDARTQAHDFDGSQDSGPMKCLWMLAGVVDYKLCDRRYDCDQCPFDSAIRDGAHAHRGLEQTAIGDSLGGINVQGYELMPMLFYHPYHLWARIEDAGSVRIGLDDFGQRLMGRVYAIELPTPGTTVSRSVACWRVAHHAGETSIAVPVSGLVLQVNPRLSQHPSLINRDPYGEGWVLVIQPAHLEQCLKRLYYGGKVEQWYERDIEKLYRAMSDMLVSSLPTVGATMQDGGSRIQDFTSLLTADQMRQMIDSFLSAPVSDRSAATGAEVMGPDQGR